MFTTQPAQPVSLHESTAWKLPACVHKMWVKCRFIPIMNNSGRFSALPTSLPHSIHTEFHTSVSARNGSTQRCTQGVDSLLEVLIARELLLDFADRMDHRRVIPAPEELADIDQG